MIRSFGFAWDGLKMSFSTETNFRIHIFLAVVTFIFGIGLRISVLEWFVVVLCATAVLTAELFNTAIEKLCDIVEPEFHPGIKMIKDISAAAVLLSAIASSIIGLVIFTPKLFELLKLF
ncbi:MAG TPA: diacylglycerol kinase family protein [Ferruginibacter sp.]|nr:diacylglycerol kinase family protein [Ferruginibacter sp.]